MAFPLPLVCSTSTYSYRSTLRAIPESSSIKLSNAANRILLSGLFPDLFWLDPPKQGATWFRLDQSESSRNREPSETSQRRIASSASCVKGCPLIGWLLRRATWPLGTSAPDQLELNTSENGLAVTWLPGLVLIATADLVPTCFQCYVEVPVLGGISVLGGCLVQLLGACKPMCTPAVHGNLESNPEQ